MDNNNNRATMAQRGIEDYMEVEGHIDPDVQRNVSSLITALGGAGANEEGSYELGDEALACLRDLKKWLRLFDDKNNRMDVARCIAEHNLVGGDLLQILALWPENETNNKIKSRIALACVELLTPLTWYLPKEKDVEDDQKKHIPYLTMAQVEYKRQIINFDGARILHTVTRTALPSIAVPLKERSNRDNNIIRMLLYFIRNITMIEPPKGRETDGDEAEISRSALIDAYQYQDVLYLLLALCSGDFGHQDVVILEVLFHLIKGIDIDTLFMNEKEKTAHQFDALAELRSKEAGMRRSYQRTAPSRHGRFGTMIQVSRGDGKVSTLSGQDALLDSSKVLAKMDGVKKPKPNMKRSKRDLDVMDFDKRVRLAPRAQKSMKEFVCDFLDSGFNPLFQSIKKAIQQDAERIEVFHTTMFFYLVSWFLQAERARRASQRQQKGKNAPPEDSFGLIAAVLDQPMFILINREMEILASDGCPLHHELKAAMRCFTQVLLTVQDMYDSPLEEDQEIAENILQRIFHEETTHDRVVKIVATYHTNEGDKDFGFLDACTELSHVFLRLLENYSKVNKDIFIKSKQRKRRKTKAKAAANGNEGLDLGNDEDDMDDRQYAVVSKDRKLDFKKFAAKFVTQNCVNTFVKLLQYYNELKPEQLKRCHRYFHRVAFKMDFSVMLFRLDIIALLNKMIKGPGGLGPASKTFKEWNELIVHVFRLMTKKLKERPELFVEILFSKTTPVANFIMHGHETVVVATQKPVRAWEVKKSVPEEKWIATVVSAMLDNFEAHLLEWYKSELVRIEAERRSWEEANKALELIEPAGAATPASAAPTEDDADAIPPTAEVEKAEAPSVVLSPFSTTIRTAILKNPRLRLLFTLCGLTQIGDEEEIEGTLWIVPSSVSADQIKENLAEIHKAEFDPLTGENFTDGKGAEEQLKPVSNVTTRKRADYDDGDNELEDDWDDELFPAGGPTNIHKKDALALLRKKNRTSVRVGEDKVLTLEQEESRRLLKEKKDREKQRRIKSSLFVHDSDDNSDADSEFFAKEEALRKAKETGSFVAKMGEKSEKKKARKKVNGADADDEDDHNMWDATSASALSSAHASPEPELLMEKKPRKRTPKRKVVEPQTDDEDDLKGNSSPKHAKLSESPPAGSDLELENENEKPTTTTTIATIATIDVKMVGLDDSDDELAAPRPRIRKRVVGGFVLDSSDEE